jgi:sugar/nucleoside kinase (ribokinase family)
VGDDANGTVVLESLRSAGVDTRHVTTLRGTPTGVTCVMTFPDDRAMFTLLGTISALRPEHVEPELLVGCDHLHVTSPYLLTGLTEHLPALMERARNAGMTVSLDPQWDPASRWEGLRERFVPHASVVLMNEAEAAAITGSPDPGRAAATIRGWGAEEVIVKRGAAGALGIAGDQLIEQPGYPIEPVDTTGAGDSFNAGYVKRRVGDRRSLGSSLAYACAVGALSCLRVGGATEPIGHGEALRMTGESQ